MKTKLALINKAYERLSWAFDAEMINWAKRLFDRCREEEKLHRGWGPDFASHHTTDTISINQAAKLFAVKRVAEYLRKPEYPKGKDYLHTQTSCFIAAGMAEEFGPAICTKWADLDMAELAALDYTQFVKVKAAQP